ncbi:hypothetical protein GGQ99_004729 [Aminobacter niigataensis]|uniref:5-bromo-4-chloroindolyl phosphate hydrolysis protein n=1 Tax=Aminobacter niigataensis TaxID=83265 RepID=A0ABR6L881_9HYPH|nr:hypothetical protein [Aminobacter niigataensis]MBB4652945.1 hypothetical protein [Aminobacter niigataensis]
MGDKISRGWEFWLGAALVTAAISVIAAAFFVAELREIVSKLGAATAAIAVVGAALIAYSGAMAKVRYDYKGDLGKKSAARNNLTAKFKFLTSRIILESREIKTSLVAAKGTYAPARAVTPADFQLSEPSEMKELWDQLEQLPKDAVSSIGIVRLRYAQYQRLHAGYMDMIKIASIHPGSLRSRETEMINTIDAIIGAAQNARASFENQDKPK